VERNLRARLPDRVIGLNSGDAQRARRSRSTHFVIPDQIGEFGIEADQLARRTDERVRLACPV